MKLLTGGGPNIVANTQVAKTATQTVGKTVATGDQKIDKIEGHAVRVEQIQSQDSKVKAETVEKVVINETPPWVILLLLLGWLLPTPQDIGNRIYLWLSHLVSKLKWRN
jgi:predicted DCC family thiol-disulfide oxidoreductase YuxK